MGLLSRLKKRFGKKSKPVDFEIICKERESELSKILGEPTESLFHAVVPFYLGGSADVMVFPNYISGATYVTAEMTGCDDQMPNQNGNYELMFCTRSDNTWAANILSVLARYTTETVLNPGDTMDCPAFPDSQLTALLYADPGTPSYTVNGRKASLLLCVGITQAELELSRASGSEALISKLREANVFPYTDPERQRVV